MALLKQTLEPEIFVKHRKDRMQDWLRSSPKRGDASTKKGQVAQPGR